MQQQVVSNMAIPEHRKRGQKRPFLAILSCAHVYKLTGNVLRRRVAMRCSRGFCIVAGEAPAAPGRCACPQVFRDHGMRRRGTVTPWLAGFLVAATLGGGVQGVDQPGDEKPLSFELDYDFRG